MTSFLTPLPTSTLLSSALTSAISEGFRAGKAEQAQQAQMAFQQRGKEYEQQQINNREIFTQQSEALRALQSQKATAVKSVLDAGQKEIDSKQAILNTDSRNLTDPARAKLAAEISADRNNLQAATSEYLNNPVGFQFKGPLVQPRTLLDTDYRPGYIAGIKAKENESIAANSLEQYKAKAAGNTYAASGGLTTDYGDILSGGRLGLEQKKFTLQETKDANKGNYPVDAMGFRLPTQTKMDIQNAIGSLPRQWKDYGVNYKKYADSKFNDMDAHSAMLTQLGPIKNNYRTVASYVRNNATPDEQLFLKSYGISLDPDSYQSSIFDDGRKLLGIAGSSEYSDKDRSIANTLSSTLGFGAVPGIPMYRQGATSKLYEADQ